MTRCAFSRLAPPMKLLEYQAKQRFAAAGIAVPAGPPGAHPEEAADCRA